jgi:hypothetical protein
MSVPLYRSLFSKSDWVVAVSMILVMTSVEAQEKKCYFYYSLPYGSESTFNEIFRLNNYPGILKIFSVSSGIFALIGERGKCTFGMTLSVFPLGICGYHPR